MKLLKYIVPAAALMLMTASCTNLDETLYDQVGSDNYYNTQLDVTRAVYRPFEHCFWSIQSRQVINEVTADQLITPTRDGWWDDSGVWRRLHYHEYNVEDGRDIQTEWNGCFQGIMQCCWITEDLDRLDPDKFGFTTEEFNNIKSQCRALRAWLYIRLLDAFRNVPLATSYYHPEENTKGQVAPEVLFKFIEDELLEVLPLIGKKEALGGQDAVQGKWTQASVAALLVRLYLNAETYIGVDRYDDCATMCKRILDGEFGPYEVADRWDAAFDYDNNNCDEVIFGYPADGGYTYWHYQGDTYLWTTPSQVHFYLGDTKAKSGGHNTKYAASPSLAPNGKEYNYDLGMPIKKFKKYPSDYRLKLYKNLGNSKREGMFFFGYLDYIDANGQPARVKAPERPYELYIRDAVGNFQDLAPDQWLEASTATLKDGDHNSGWHFAKYPFYADTDEHQLESDYTEIRLPEIIYSYAECLLRAGKTDEAAKQLNKVRARNYPEADHSTVLYAPEGAAKLDMAEMLDEWGREFFAEGRRRIDLIRFGKYSSSSWWDKTPDADKHTEIFPIMREILNSNPDLVQNPGYNK